MPRYAMIQAGLNPDKDVKIEYAGGHPQSLLALVNGKVDAGEINSQQQATATAAHQFDAVEVPGDLAVGSDPERPDHRSRQPLAGVQGGGHEGAAEDDAEPAEAASTPSSGSTSGPMVPAKDSFYDADPRPGEGRAPQDHGHRLIRRHRQRWPGARISSRSAPEPVLEIKGLRKAFGAPRGPERGRRRRSARRADRRAGGERERQVDAAALRDAADRARRRRGVPLRRRACSRLSRRAAAASHGARPRWSSSRCCSCAGARRSRTSRSARWASCRCTARSRPRLFPAEVREPRARIARPRRPRRSCASAGRHALRAVRPSGSRSPGPSASAHASLLADEPVASLDPRAAESVLCAARRRGEEREPRRARRPPPARARPPLCRSARRLPRRRRSASTALRPARERAPRSKRSTGTMTTSS